MLCFGALNLNASSAPGGAEFADSSIATVTVRATYFPDHEYLKFTPVEQLPVSAQNVHDTLARGSALLVSLNTQTTEWGDLEWVVDSRSTDANIVHCLLGKSDGFDVKCCSISTKLKALKENIDAMRADSEMATKLQPSIAFNI